MRITRILWERKQLQTGARQFVSQNKRRYQRHGFDLDLTYVISNVIATSFPSSGKLSLYRNDIKVIRFFLNCVSYLEASEPKGVNSNYILYGVNLLRLVDLVRYMV